MENLNDISWLGHASFFFTDKTTGNKIYYVDPFDLHATNLEKADLLFITHAHPDHDSPDDIRKIIKNDTILIATPDVVARLNMFPNEKQEVAPNQSYSVKNFNFSTVPAYNVNPQRLEAHPKENNWVGYIFQLNGKKIYHAGDTDFIPEMKELKQQNLDVAMLPMGGKYTMDVDDMIEAANTIAAKVTIPMHYKRLLGDAYKDAEEKLKQSVTASQVVILEELK